MKYHTKPTSDGKVTIMRTTLLGSRPLVVSDINMNFGNREIHPIELSREDGDKLCACYETTFAPHNSKDRVAVFAKNGGPSRRQVLVVRKMLLIWMYQ